MSEREALIQKTIDNLSHLPNEKIRELSDYSEFLLCRITDQILINGIQQHVETSVTYKFLLEEEDIYTVQDLKETYK